MLMLIARARRFVVLLAVLMATLLSAGITGATAYAPQVSGAQNCIGAFAAVVQQLIGSTSTRSPCSRPDSTVPAARIAVGFCVATEGGAGALPPIAGGAEMTADDLTGGAASNYGRFLKSLPASAEEPTITGLPGGGFKFEADVPASNIPGSYATYTKEIGSDGVTTTFYKTTYAPDGSVVSVKVKYP
jgi:hypothetical protein